jgi:hypothetical protein
MLVERRMAAGFANRDRYDLAGGGDLDEYHDPTLDALLAGPARVRWIRKNAGHVRDEAFDRRSPRDRGPGRRRRGDRTQRGDGQQGSHSRHRHDVQRLDWRSDFRRDTRSERRRFRRGYRWAGELDGGREILDRRAGPMVMMIYFWSADWAG